MPISFRIYEETNQITIIFLDPDKMFFDVNSVVGKLSELLPTTNNIHHAQSFDSYAIYRNHNPRFRFLS